MRAGSAPTARVTESACRAAAASDTDEPVVETSSFTVDLAAKKVTKNNTEVHLTPTEWGMLEMLVRNRGKLVGREELLKEVWGPAYAKETHYLRVYLAALRRKRTELRDLASGPAKLTQAMGIDKALYGVDMTKKGPLYIAEPKEQESLAIRVTPRIGISRAMDVPWRFVVAGSRFLSK